MTLGHMHVLLLMSCYHLYSVLVEFHVADVVLVVLYVSRWWVGLQRCDVLVQMYARSNI